MNKQKFTGILFSAVIIAYIVQFVTAIDGVGNILSDYTYAVTAGLFIYTGEFLFFWLLLKSNASLLWEPFKGKEVAKGIAAFSVVILVTNFGVHAVDTQRIFGGQHDLSRYLTIFLFNLLPSAITEEWVYRFLPVRLVKLKIIRSPIVFYFFISVVFMLAHGPKYFFGAGMGALDRVFISGLFFLLIYLLTGNLMYVSMIHAFTNGPWFVFDSTSNGLFLYISLAVVTATWCSLNFVGGRTPAAPRY